MWWILTWGVGMGGSEAESTLVIHYHVIEGPSKKLHTLKGTSKKLHELEGTSKETYDLNGP